MESPEYVSSPENGPRRSHNRRSPPPLAKAAQDDRERPTHIRFLASNTAAGCIIGKGGATINEFQAQSGARIQLSRNHEFFPGTSDRIIMISGSVDEVLKAMELILEKLLSEAEENNDADSSRSKLRLVVPNSSCGGIIGKGGSTIKSFIEESQADIKISPQDHNNIGLNDRLVTVVGTLDEQMRALSLIMSKLIEDSHYPATLSSPFPYAGVNFPGFPGGPNGYVIPPVSYNSMSYGSNGIGGRYPNKGSSSQGALSRSPAGSHENNSVTIGVADEHIGAVVGRGGRNIMEITQASGARIKISDRGDFMPGTSDRKVTITGSTEAIQSAEAMIMQRVSSNSERE